MLTELQKSIRAILYERSASPLSGAFAISWITWNWKLIYFIFYRDPQLTLTQQMSFIESHFLSFKTIVIYPAISTVCLITLYPLISLGAYWIWIRYRSIKIELRNKTEKKRMLTVEESMELRMELINQEERMEKSFKKKDDEITNLKEMYKRADEQKESAILREKQKSEEIANLTKMLNQNKTSVVIQEVASISKNNQQKIPLSITLQELEKRKEIFKYFEKIAQSSIDHSQLFLPDEIKSFYVANEIATYDHISSSFKLTKLGNEIYKELVNKKML